MMYTIVQKFGNRIKRILNKTKISVVFNLFIIYLLQKTC